MQSSSVATVSNEIGDNNSNNAFRLREQCKSAQKHMIFKWSYDILVGLFNAVFVVLARSVSNAGKFVEIYEKKKKI